MRIFNRFGRRDNIHHARIKVVVKNWGLEKFRDAVEAEYQRILGSDEDGTLKLLPEDIDYMRSCFPTPAYRPVEQAGTDTPAPAAQETGRGSRRERRRQ